MIYAQDYARVGKMVCLLILCVSTVGITYGSIGLLQRLDKTALYNKHTTVISKISLCMLSGELVSGFSSPFDVADGNLTGRPYPNFNVEMILLSIFAGCLLSACIMDVESKMIYNYVWWIAWLVAMIFLWWKGMDFDLELFLFILLQEMHFSKLYGRADCHAFVACAMLERALGMGMKEYLIHMLLSYVFLAVVQGFKRNIGRNGNLKKPIPFLPYIAVSFWVLIYWEKSAIFIRV